MFRQYIVGVGWSGAPVCKIMCMCKGGRRESRISKCVQNVHAKNWKMAFYKGELFQKSQKYMKCTCACAWEGGEVVKKFSMYEILCMYMGESRKIPRRRCLAANRIYLYYKSSSACLYFTHSNNFLIHSPHPLRMRIILHIHSCSRSQLNDTK